MRESGKATGLERWITQIYGRVVMVAVPSIRRSSLEQFGHSSSRASRESGVDEALRPGDLNLRREQSFLDRWTVFWGAVVVLVQTFILRQRHQTVVPMRAARPVRFRRFLDAVQVLAET